MLRLGILWCLLALPLLLHAQTEGAVACRWLKPTTSPQSLDSLTVLPQSISLQDSSLLWHFNLSTGTIQFKGSALPDSVWICYTRLPYSLHQPVQNRSLALYDSLAPFKLKPRRKEETWQQEELFSTEDIQKSGSISRGISFGNTQDVFVQSALNLQLEGQLTEKIGIRASISDQNIPFQPDGNTQNLQEFDKVFVELFTDSSALMAGDLQLLHTGNTQQGGSSFLRYQRNVQGLSFKTRASWLGAGPTETTLSLAAARGQFTAVELDPVEGMLGPYRLQGSGGQGYVMVLANSEKVYLDGRLLQRGYQNDYIIDYNLGEITFTPGTMITRYSRIRVEYEFADQHYRRGILTGGHRQQRGKLEYFAHFYQEKDNRFQPLFFELNEADMQQLSEAGDRFTSLWSNTWDSVAYSADLLLYRRVDTLDVAGQPTQVFVYSTNEATAAYRLGFTDVGQGKGNYELQEITPKGRVYRWVSPVGGIPQGQFEPVRQLEAPKKRQLFSAGLSHRLGKWGKIYTELAFSEQDQNLFSEIDEADDRGMALKSGYALEDMPVFFNKSWRWKAGVEYELLNRHFTPVDRFRAVEYDRYWGLLAQQGWGVEAQAYGKDDHLIQVWGGLEKDADNRLHYRFHNRHLPGLVQGWQQELEAAKTLGIWAGSGNLFLMQNQQEEQLIKWHRLQLDQHLNFKHLVPGYAYAQEQNIFEQAETEKVLQSAQHYREHRFYVRNPENLKSQYLLEYSLREDEAPVQGKMEEANKARQLRAQWYSNPELAHQFGVLMSYRESDALLDSLKELNQEQILTGQLQWNSQLWEGAFKQQLTYSTGSGQEIKRDYIYVKVPTGQGTHVWRDHNGDEEQQLEEFFEAVLPDEKLYIRLLVPGTELTQAYHSEIQYRLTLNGPQAWRDRQGILKILHAFSANLHVRLSQKLMEGSNWQRFMPASADLAQGSLLHRRQQWQANVFYNRSNPVWGLEAGFHQNTRKQLLSNGYEIGDHAQYHLSARRSFTRSWNIKMGGMAGNQEDLSDFLANDRYDVRFWGLEPQLTWRPGQQLEIDLTGSYRSKQNALGVAEAREAAQIQEVGLGILLSRQLRTSVRGQVKVAEILYEGSTSTPVSYALLEALKPGTNWSWNLQLQQRLMRGLMLNVIYDGRRSEEALAVHTGRMMLRALF